MMRLRRHLVVAREVLDVRGRVDVPRAVDRAHLEREEAFLHQRHRPRALAGGPLLLERDGIPRRDRLGRLGQLDLEQPALELEVLVRRLVVAALEPERHRLLGVLDRPAHVLAVRRLGVVVRRVADVLERARVAPAVLRALAAALVRLGARHDAVVDGEALAEYAVRERRAAVVGDRVELRVAPAVAAVLDRLVARRRLVQEARGVRRQHDLERDLRLLADAAGVEVAALGVDVPVAAAALERAADDRVARDDRAVRLRGDLRHEVGLDDADGAADGRRVPPDGVALEPDVAVGVVEEAAAADCRLVAGDRRVLDLRVAVGHAEEAAAASAFLRDRRPR